MIDDELHATQRAWANLVGTPSNGQVDWRPAPGAWPVAKHLAHHTRSRYEPAIGLAKMRIVSLGQWFAITPAHHRRHLWLTQRVVAHPRFPLSDHAPTSTQR